MKETAALAFALGCFFAVFAKVGSSLWLKGFWLLGLGDSYCVDGRREFFYENLVFGLKGGLEGVLAFCRFSFFFFPPFPLSLRQSYKQLNLARTWL